MNNPTTTRPLGNGDTKLSEIAVDEVLPFVTGSQANGNALTTQEVAFRAITELVRKTNYILRSEGFMAWDGTNIRWDSLVQNNSINLEILGTEGTVNSSMQLRMQGSIAGPASPTFTGNATSGNVLLTNISSFANLYIGMGLSGTDIAVGAYIVSMDTVGMTITMSMAATGGTNTTVTVTPSNPGNGVVTYQNITMNDGDLLYLELDSTQLVDQGMVFNIQNAVNGGGTQVGMRLLKVPMTTALPKLQIGLTGGGSIFYIPLALRRGTQLWWIPHGIMWPSGTISTLGAVIVSGIQPWPNHFVNNQAGLVAACSQCASDGGGIILVTDQTVTITQTITLPPRTKLLGRGMGINLITMGPGGQIVMQDFSSLDQLYMQASSGFTGTMISMQGTRPMIRESQIDISLTTNVATNIIMQTDCNEARILGNNLVGVSSGNRIGIKYNSGANNTDVDTVYY